MARIPRLSDYRVVLVSDGFIVPIIWDRSFGPGGLFILVCMVVLELSNSFGIVFYHLI